MLTPSEVEAMRSYHDQRRAERRARREALRLDWLAKARQAITELAPQFPQIKTVHLFGSLMRSGHFHEESDIDIAVSSDDVEAESRFWAALEQRLHRDVDLRPLRGAILRAVELGELVYEREEPT